MEGSIVWQFPIPALVFLMLRHAWVIETSCTHGKHSGNILGSHLRSFRYCDLQWQNIWHRSGRHNLLSSSGSCISLLILHIKISPAALRISKADTYRLESRGLLESPSVSLLTLIPVQISQPSMKARVFVPNHLQIALENGEVRNIEPDQGRVQSDIRFRNILSK